MEEAPINVNVGGGPSSKAAGAGSRPHVPGRVANAASCTDHTKTASGKKRLASQTLGANWESRIEKTKRRLGADRAVRVFGLNAEKNGPATRKKSLADGQAGKEPRQNPQHAGPRGAPTHRRGRRTSSLRNSPMQKKPSDTTRRHRDQKEKIKEKERKDKKYTKKKKKKKNKTSVNP